MLGIRIGDVAVGRKDVNTHDNCSIFGGRVLVSLVVFYLIGAWVGNSGGFIVRRMTYKVPYSCVCSSKPCLMHLAAGMKSV